MMKNVAIFSKNKTARSCQCRIGAGDARDAAATLSIFLVKID